MARIVSMSRGSRRRKREQPKLTHSSSSRFKLLFTCSICNLRRLTKTLGSNCAETPPAASSYSSVIRAPVPAKHVKLLHGGLGGGCVVTDLQRIELL